MNLCRSIFYLMPSSICSTIACIDRFTTSQYCFILTLNLIALVSLSSRFWFSYGVFYYLEQTPLLHILRNTSPSHLLSCFWVEISIFQETLVWRVQIFRWMMVLYPDFIQFSQDYQVVLMDSQYVLEEEKQIHFVVLQYCFPLKLFNNLI